MKKIVTIFLAICISQIGKTQCPNFKVYESFLSTVPTQGGTWLGTNVTYLNSNTLSRTGNYSTVFDATADAIRTPIITNPDIFSFWYRRSTVSATHSFLVETSPDLVTWTTRGTPYTGTMNVTYSQYTINLGALGLTNVYVRIRDTRSSGLEGWYIDDVSWTSTVALENNLILSANGSVTTNTCSTTINCGTIYTFTDQGGASDAYHNDQNHTVTFTPSNPLKKLKVTFISFSTETNRDGLMIYDGANTSAPLISSGAPAGSNPLICPAGAFSGSNSPGIKYSSGPSGAITFQFQSDNIFTPAGWVATIECVDCAPAVISTANIIPNCASSQWSYTVNVTSLGGASSLGFSGTASPATVTTVPTTVSFGPFASNTAAPIVSVTHSNNTCNSTIPALSYTCVPANDNCNTATALGTIPYTGNCLTLTGQTTVGATNSMVNPNPSLSNSCLSNVGSPDDDVWYTFVASTTTHYIELQNVSGGTDMYFQVFSSGSCGSLMTALLCSDPNLGTVNSLTIGTTYFIRVYTVANAASATFDLCVRSTPPPPVCIENTDYIAPANAVQVAPQPFVTLTWKNVSTATSYDVYINAGAPPTTFIANVATAVGATTSYNWTGAVSFQQYLWRVVPRNSYGAAIGCTAISVFITSTTLPTPPNDLCIHATALVLGNGFCTNPITGTVVDASVDLANVPCYAGSNEGVWYRIVAPASGNLIVQTSAIITGAGIGNDFLMAAYTGACGSLTNIECKDFGNPEDIPNNLHPRMELTGLTPNSNVYILVFPKNAIDKHSFSICAWEPLPTPTMVIAPGVNNICDNASTPLTISAANSNIYCWTPIRDAANEIIAEVYANGNSLGTITTSYYTTNGPVRVDGNGQRYLNRNYTISVQNQPITPVKLRLFFSAAEEAALHIANGNAVGQVLDINLTKTNSSTCTNIFVDNNSQYNTQTGFGGDNTSPTGFYTEYSISSFSSFFLAAGGTVLPITLINFKAVPEINSNKLLWNTETEIDNSKFIIERSFDAVHFDSIGVVVTKAINGNSSNTLSYIYEDLQPQKNKQYYRLKIIDKSNRFKYSEIVAVRRTTGAIEIVDVRPNPTSGMVTFNVSGSNNKLVITLRSMEGTTIISKKTQQLYGLNVDLSNLPAGIYLLEVEDAENGSKSNQKIVKY